MCDDDHIGHGYGLLIQWIEAAQTKVQGYPNAVGREQLVRHSEDAKIDRSSLHRCGGELHYNCALFPALQRGLNAIDQGLRIAGLGKKPCAPADNARNFTLSSGNAVIKIIGSRCPAEIKQC